VLNLGLENSASVAMWGLALATWYIMRTQSCNHGIRNLYKGW